MYADLDDSVPIVINTVKFSKSYEVDGISSVIYKDSGSDILNLPQKPITLSTEASTWPHCWKIAYTIQRYKSWHGTDMNNYIHINIVSAISGINDELSNHLPIV